MDKHADVEFCDHKRTTVYTEEHQNAVWDDSGDQVTETYRTWVERCDRCAEVVDCNPDA